MRYWLDVDGDAVFLSHDGRSWWSPARPCAFRDLEHLRGVVAALRARGYRREL